MIGLSDGLDRKIRSLALRAPVVFDVEGGGGISISEQFLQSVFVTDKSFPGLLITVDVNSGKALAGSRFSEGVFSLECMTFCCCVIGV